MKVGRDDEDGPPECRDIYPTHCAYLPLCPFPAVPLCKVAEGMVRSQSDPHLVLASCLWFPIGKVRTLWPWVKLRPRRSTSPSPTRTTTNRGVSQLHEPGGPDASADHSEQTKSREKETLIGAYPVGRAKRANMRCQKYVRKCWGLMVGARCRAISRFGAAKKSVAVRRRHCWRRPNDKVQGRAAAYVAGDA